MFFKQCCAGFFVGKGSGLQGESVGAAVVKVIYHGNLKIRRNLMKIHIISCALMLLLSAYVVASEKFVTVSGNMSHFYDMISKPRTGYSIGCGWEWNKNSKSSILFSPSYLYRSVYLNNKSVWLEFDELFIVDITCRIGYLDFPIEYRYYVKNHATYLSGGLSPCIAVYDGSEAKIIERSPVHNRPETDFTISIDPGFAYQLSSSSVDVFLGAGTMFGNYSISGLMRASLGNVGNVDKGEFELNSKLISYIITLSWYY